MFNVFVLCFILNNLFVEKRKKDHKNNSESFTKEVFSKRRFENNIK